MAVYKNISECDSELNFESGDLLDVLEFNTMGLEGWWLCQLKGQKVSKITLLGLSLIIMFNKSIFFRIPNMN